MLNSYGGERPGWTAHKEGAPDNVWGMVTFLFRKSAGKLPDADREGALEIWLALLQVFFNPLRLADQEWNVLIRRLNESADDPHGLFELLCELELFLITPAVTEIHSCPCSTDS